MNSSTIQHRKSRIANQFFVLLLFASVCEASDVMRHVVALDIGHTRRNGGARSARGVMEFDFNKNVVEAVASELEQSSVVRPVIINPKGAPILLGDRTKIAAEQGAELFLSVHHDSVQPKYLSEWTINGRKEHYCDRFKGFSIFYSSKNPFAEQSSLLAHLLGNEMRSRDFEPTFHHAEKIRGEGRKLMDPQRGVYEYDDLIVLKTAKVPAALIECGVIVNRDEEEQLKRESTRDRIASAISSAIVEYFGPHQAIDEPQQANSSRGLSSYNGTSSVTTSAMGSPARLVLWQAPLRNRDRSHDSLHPTGFVLQSDVTKP
jgi:N-acetylmuramoyl-L-alanine amidase